jgi:RNA polymerase sigma-70 factor (ECF subfamily)
MAVAQIHLVRGAETGGVASAGAPPAREASAAETDVALVEALRAGTPGAELAAWNRFSAGVDRTLRRLLGPGPDNEDLLQEVFLRFFGRIGTLREPAAVRGFLTGICVHVVHAEILGRKRRRWLKLTFTGELPEADARTTGKAADPDAREAVARYYRLLDGLGAKDRSLFVARTIEGLTLDEVAAVHGVSVSTAQRKIRRAAKRIAAQVRRDPLLVQFAEGAAP